MIRIFFTFLFSVGVAQLLYSQEVFLDKNGKYGIKNASGKIIIRGVYDSIDVFTYDGGAPYAVMKNKKWGFCNSEGKLLINYKYDGAASFSEDLARVKIDDKFGFINRQGKIVLPPIYDYATNFIKGEAQVDLNGKTIIINKKGKNLNKEYSPDNSPWF